MIELKWKCREGATGKLRTQLLGGLPVNVNSVSDA